jgi:hypothetical protein
MRVSAGTNALFDSFSESRLQTCADGQGRSKGGGELKASRPRARFYVFM